MKFTLKKALGFGWKGIKGWAYNSKKDFPRASAAFFKVTKSHGKVKSLISDRIYFVVEGKGKFIIKDETIPVKKFDVIIVPKNTPYDYEGGMKLFLVHTPAFDQKYEINMVKK